MKIIDLLNKIANGEEVPKKIQWGEFILVWEELGFHDYKFLGTGNHLMYQGFATSVLNEEVEIIEEDKKIENIYLCCMSTENKETKFLIQNINDLADKINEIIDRINEEE